MCMHYPPVLSFLCGKISTLSDYKDILDMFVCDQQKGDCMVGKCDQCPGQEAVEKQLRTIFGENDYDMDDRIEYPQWVSVDRSSIVRESSTIEEFVQLIASRTKDLAYHHYVKEQQSLFLRNLKANLKSTEVIIQMDFAENYGFLAQDSAQSFHWNNSQASLHPSPDCGVF